MSLPEVISPTPENYMWASFIYNRSPRFKAHEKKSHALNALNTHTSFNRSGMGLYRLEEGEWHLEEEVPPAVCIECHEEGKYTYPASRELTPAYRNPRICHQCRSQGYQNKYV